MVPPLKKHSLMGRQTHKKSNKCYCVGIKYKGRAVYYHFLSQCNKMANASFQLY